MTSKSTTISYFNDFQNFLKTDSLSLPPSPSIYSIYPSLWDIYNFKSRFYSTSPFVAFHKPVSLFFSPSLQVSTLSLTKIIKSQLTSSFSLFLSLLSTLTLCLYHFLCESAVCFLPLKSGFCQNINKNRIMKGGGRVKLRTISTCASAKALEFVSIFFRRQRLRHFHKTQAPPPPTKNTRRLK